MPILDPSVQYFLLKNTNKQTDERDGFPFFFKYLQFASRNLSRNSTTIDASIQFKKDLQDSILLINDEFGCNFSVKKDIDNFEIIDIYRHFFKHINYPNKIQESKKYVGNYFICNDKFQTKFYRPYTLLYEYHSWYFTDTPIAILCVDSTKFTDLDDKRKKKILQFIKLEIDLMEASGLILVLCYNGDNSTENFLYKIIDDNQFSELHINIYDNNILYNFLDRMKNKYFRKNNKYKGFIYLYSYFFDPYLEESGFVLMNIVKKMPRIKIISFSKPPEKALIKIESSKTSQFPHCKTGFDYEYLRIFICFIPIFKRDKVLTANFSDLSIGYIKKEDFLIENCFNKRTEIIMSDSSTFEIYFNDIHFVKPDLYVQSMLSLTQIDEETHEEISELKEKIDAIMNENYDEFQNKWKPANFDNYKKLIIKIASAYTYLMRTKHKIPDFSIRPTQIYTVLESYKTFFPEKFDKKMTHNYKGAIYQIKTGEGKSCIVSLIAAALAHNNFIVHVVSSNIKLCNRDYQESLEFYTKLDLQSSVLLHQNELPYYNDSSNLNVENNNLIEYYENYPQYYSDEQFENTSKMNFSVCGIDPKIKKANIVFSTFVNFECFYMYLMENYPGYIDKYIQKECGLLIDEADSIFIDEMENGTFESKEIRSNAKKVLSLVYNLKEKGKTEQETLDILKKMPLCKDIDLKDINQMYKEIDKVNDKTFCVGSFYSIESFEVKNTKRLKNIFKKTLNNAKDKIVSIFKKNKEEDSVEEIEEEEEINDYEDEDETSELNINDSETNKTVEFKKIVPFDSKNKGIIEPNKEFGGFIPQFIALKESKNNPNIIFKDISVNYLYVSHPIYAKLYKKICGFTGTIGKINDKAIFNIQYDLKTKKVPRHKPNLRIDFPITACNSKSQRNNLISNEVLEFHEKGNPVLVIFQYFTEIFEVLDAIKYLSKDNSLLINIFDGKDDLIKPDLISGLKGSITLGTNICGRGTDIKCSPDYPLHVIVSYYSDNSRMMQQAFGRTARNGQIGSCHCICLKFQLYMKNLINPTKISTSLNKMALKEEKQREYIENIKKNHSWIFDYIEFKKYGKLKELDDLRKSRINVNRIVAYKYRYPICMKYRTFFRIQAQKIYSLFNCPNSVYTWRLFQQYVRQMVLESWTLMIRSFDQRYDHIKKIEKYQEKLNRSVSRLNQRIEKYLLPEKNDYISVFHHISKIVIGKYSKKVLNSMGSIIDFNNTKLGEFSKLHKYFDAFSNTIFQIGFKPYSLLSKSGTRIGYSNLGDMNYILDPELKYMKKLPHNKFSFISITERIDEIFNKILCIVNSKLSNFCFLKFFLRRTLTGCEFGVCLDLILNNKKIGKNPFILVDKNPLLVVTLFVWSLTPFLGVLLIILLIFLLVISKKIAQFVMDPAGFIIRKAKDFLVSQAIKICSKPANMLFDKIIDFLYNMLKKQLHKIEKFDQNFATIIQFIKKIFDKIGYEKNKPAKKINTFFESIEVSPFFHDVIKECAFGPKAVEIGVLLILNIVAFLRNFSHSLSITFKKNLSKDAKEYDSSFDKNTTTENEENKENDKYLLEEQKKRDDKLIELEEKRKGDVLNKMEVIDEIENEELNFNDIFEKLMKTKYYQFYQKKLENEENKLEIVNELDFEFAYNEVKPMFKKGPNYVVHLPTKKLCYQVFFNPNKVCYWDAISTFTKLKHPIITPYVGFVFNSKQSFMIFDIKSKDSIVYNLSDVFDKITKFYHLTKLIFLYEIACGMEFLHMNKIVYHYFSPKNIFLADNCYPLILGFEPRNNEKDERFIDPQVKHFEEEEEEEEENENENDDEFDIQDSENDFDWKKTNVYSFGIILQLLFKDFDWRMEKSANKQVIDELVEKCCNSDPSKRFTFSEICDYLENVFKTYIMSNNNKEYISKLKKQRPNY